MYYMSFKFHIQAAFSKGLNIYKFRWLSSLSNALMRLPCICHRQLAEYLICVTLLHRPTLWKYLVVVMYQSH